MRQRTYSQPAAPGSAQQVLRLLPHSLEGPRRRLPAAVPNKRQPASGDSPPTGPQPDGKPPPTRSRNTRGYVRFCEPGWEGKKKRAPVTNLPGFQTKLLDFKRSEQCECFHQNWITPSHEEKRRCFDLLRAVCLGSKGSCTSRSSATRDLPVWTVRPQSDPSFNRLRWNRSSEQSSNSPFAWGATV